MGETVLMEYRMFCPSCGGKVHFDPSNHVMTCLDAECAARYKVEVTAWLVEEFYKEAEGNG